MKIYYPHFTIYKNAEPQYESEDWNRIQDNVTQQVMCARSIGGHPAWFMRVTVEPLETEPQFTSPAVLPCSAVHPGQDVHHPEGHPDPSGAIVKTPMPGWAMWRLTLNAADGTYMGTRPALVYVAEPTDFNGLVRFVAPRWEPQTYKINGVDVWSVLIRMSGRAEDI